MDYSRYKKSELIEMLVRSTRPQITGPSPLIGLVLEKLEPYRNQETEHFLVATLDGSHRIINLRMITKGLVNRTIVHPREVFRGAIADNAVAIIIAHNHPSGNLTPSPEDHSITIRLVEAGEILGIKVIDHIIIGLSLHNFYSFNDNGDIHNTGG